MSAVTAFTCISGVVSCRQWQPQAVAAANTLAQRMADERLVTAVLEHMLLLRTANAARLPAALVAAHEPCPAARSADAARRPLHPASAAANAVDDNCCQLAGCASSAAAVAGSKALRAAAQRSVQQRAAQAVRRQLLMSAAGAAARSAGHVAASMPVSGSKSVPTDEAPAQDVVLARNAAEVRQRHCQPGNCKNTAAGRGGQGRSCVEVVQPCVEGLQHCMPTCPPSKPGRRSSIWAPARLDDEAL